MSNTQPITKEQLEKINKPDLVKMADGMKDPGHGHAGSDAKGQGDDGDQGEPGGVPNGSEAEPGVLKKGLDHGWVRGCVGGWI